jgi:hypothetical protein
MACRWPAVRPGAALKASSRMSRFGQGRHAPLPSVGSRGVASFHCLTFLTDYGLEDAFVAACHGVVLRIAPKTRIIDITHLVPPGDIRRGAAVLAQTVGYLPPAVHVAVVDPGVGTARRAASRSPRGFRVRRAGQRPAVLGGSRGWAAAPRRSASPTGRCGWTPRRRPSTAGTSHAGGGPSGGLLSRSPRRAASSTWPASSRCPGKSAGSPGAALTRRSSRSTGSATRSCPSPDLRRRGPGSSPARRPRSRGTPAS